MKIKMLAAIAVFSSVLLAFGGGFVIENPATLPEDSTFHGMDVVVTNFESVAIGDDFLDCCQPLRWLQGGPVRWKFTEQYSVRLAGFNGRGANWENLQWHHPTQMVYWIQRPYYHR